MEKDDQRNFLLAMVLMIALVFGYQKFFVEPAQKKYEAQQAAIKAETQTETTERLSVRSSRSRPRPRPRRPNRQAFPRSTS